MSQAGMVVHWRRLRTPGWTARAVITGIGAVACAIVAVGTKFISGEPLFEMLGHQVHVGSWIVVVLMPILIVNFPAIHRHYERAAEQIATETPLSPSAIHHSVVVPVSELNQVAIQTLAYVCLIASGITAKHLAEDDQEIARVRTTWKAALLKHVFLREARLVLVETPYRSLIPARWRLLTTSKPSIGAAR
jgi:hypothetical protein